MIVSRADIPTDRIVDYGERSFLRLPIGNYLKILGIEPNPPQIALINAINNPKYRFIVAALARRLGKTFIANVVGQAVVLWPGCKILIVAPNYDLSNISFELQRSLLKSSGVEVVKDNAKDKIIELINGSSILIGSVNQIDSRVGRSYDLVIFDEAALSDAGEDAFNIAIRPTLDKPNSKAIFISTPRGKQNWFSRFYDRGFSDAKEMIRWCSIHATWRDNPRASEEDIMEAKATVSDAYFKQEYEADFNMFEGRIWNLPDDCIIDDIPPEVMNRCDIISGLDLGWKDPTAMCVIMFDHKTETFYIVDEYQDNESVTADQAVKISGLIDKYDIEVIYIDTANAQQRYDLAYTYGIPTSAANKSLREGIGYVASLMERGKIKVLRDCKHCIYTINQYRWDDRENLIKEKPVHDLASHMADSIRYALYSSNLLSLEL